LCARIADWLITDVASGTAGGFIGRQPVTVYLLITRHTIYYLKTCSNHCNLTAYMQAWQWLVFN
jgi:hypothetical protein